MTLKGKEFFLKFRGRKCSGHGRTADYGPGAHKSLIHLASLSIQLFLQCTQQTETQTTQRVTCSSRPHQNQQRQQKTEAVIQSCTLHLFYSHSNITLVMPMTADAVFNDSAVSPLNMAHRSKLCCL